LSAGKRRLKNQGKKTAENSIPNWPDFPANKPPVSPVGAVVSKDAADHITIHDLHVVNVEQELHVR
jgi:hypothetical protein